MTWESQRKYFNPRSHEGSDMIVCCCPSSREVFQSSLPRGERRVRVTYCTSCGNISILAPTRGATNSEAGNNRGIRFQSSLPRGERLPVPVTDTVMVAISILAPTRGATHRLVVPDPLQGISILAPTRGATKTCVK